MCTKLSTSGRNFIVRGVCIVPLAMSLSSMVLGIWLCAVIIHNSTLPLEQQIHFEKDIKWNDQVQDGGMILHMDSEQRYSNIPLDNLSLYMGILSFVTILGGFSRMLVTALFCNHICRNRLTGQLYWSWFILGCLAVAIETLLTYDILLTLSHVSDIPPYNRDFFFSNDNYWFYWLCHEFRVFIWMDVALHCLTHFVMYAIYYYCSGELD